MRSNSILLKASETAQELAASGMRFGEDLVRRYDKNWQNLQPRLPDTGTMPEGHVFFMRAIAQAFGTVYKDNKNLRDDEDWGSEDGRNDFVLECFDILVEPRDRTGDDRAEARIRVLSRVRRREGIQAGLRLWREVKLPDPLEGTALNLDLVQKQVQAASRIKREWAKWISLIPSKFYALLTDPRWNPGGDFSVSRGTTIPESVVPPLGSAVSRGIEQLLGLSFKSSLKDHELSRRLHLRLSHLAGSGNVMDINSGFYVLGGGK